MGKKISAYDPGDGDGADFITAKSGNNYKVTGNSAGGPAILDANGKVISRLAYEGAADGVATLDSTGAVEQDPASKGQANGVAALNADGIPLLASGVPVIEIGGDDTNGRWIKYLGGVLIQYGRTDYDTGSGNNKRVYYPIEFGHVMGVFLNRITSSSTPWHGTMTIVAVWPTDHFDFWAYIQGGSAGTLEASSADLKFAWLAIGTV
ncbi:hypothetical protein [Oceanithermus sp.]|uniref:gp53-like domain-containing protein n=1 Tax=Oceanithermus sp. TaxID=2268145 RepID=UPI0025DFB358|nr:hypothetical protein [Oceanithermus sp.]